MPDNNHNDNLILDYDTPEGDSLALPRARRDVEITEQVYYGKPCFVLKDPTSLRYYRLRPPEYTIYQMLDGKLTMEDVQRTLNDRFPKEEFDTQSIMSFIIMLRGANLLYIEGSANTDYLLKRKEQLSRSLWQRLRQEYLFFRIPIFDPDKMLNWLHRHLGGVIFSRFAMFLVWAVIIGALILLFDNIEKLNDRQPILSWVNLLYLGPALFLIKIIHEFGHGLTAKRFETEVHEMGVLFLVFMPCFYCDVSDSWMINEKRRRMWITAAGIVVEIILAATATYIWAFTEPKTIINQFALNVMLVASINTILFNGNPLLRYDGYYFLMDLVEIPNLRQKGSAYLWYLFQRYVLGVEKAREPIDTQGREFTIIGYAVCSTIYRWFIMVAITMMVWKFLEPYDLQVIGGVMALGVIYSSLVAPVIRFFKYLVSSHHAIHIRPVTALILLALGGAAVYGLMILPVEQTVQTQCILRPQNLHPIYITQPGFIDLEKHPVTVKDGSRVLVGQNLLTLSNPQLEFRVEDLQLKIQQKRIARDDALSIGENAEAEKIKTEIKALQSEYERACRNFEKLSIFSPADGVLQIRTNEPLQKMNGVFMPRQTEVFAVHDPCSYEAVAAVNVKDIQNISTNHVAEIKLWAMDDETIKDVPVESIPSSPVLRMSIPAFSTAFRGEVPTMPSSKGEDAIIPAENTYELVLPIPGKDSRLRDGMVGRAKIIIEKQTLGRAFYLWFINTIRQDVRL